MNKMNMEIQGSMVLLRPCMDANPAFAKGRTFIGAAPLEQSSHCVFGKLIVDSFGKTFGVAPTNLCPFLISRRTASLAEAEPEGASNARANEMILTTGTKSLRI